jgi:hypothetical protein
VNDGSLLDCTVSGDNSLVYPFSHCRRARRLIILMSIRADLDSLNPTYSQAFEFAFKPKNDLNLLSR